MLALALLVTIPLAADPVPVQAPPPAAGAAVAPAALGAGSIAFWGTLGAPDVAIGYRQGFSLLEFEAQARFHYLELSAVAEAGVRFAAWKADRAMLAPTFSLGLKVNSGSRAFDASNFAFVALRPRLGAVLSLRVSEIAQVVVTAEVPWAIALNVTGYQIAPMVGGGAEFQLNSKLSLVAVGQIGVDVIKEPLGTPSARLGWGVRLGVGYRVF
jgi:hypothetical protein